jgi:ribosomal protein L24E
VGMLIQYVEEENNKLKQRQNERKIRWTRKTKKSRNAEF